MALTRRACLSGLLAAPAVLAAPGARAAAVEVPPGGLAEALRAASPGDVLRLAPGDHGALALKGAGGRAGAPVTVTAADPARPPVLSRLDLYAPAHLVLENLRFDYRFAPGDPMHLRPFGIAGGVGVVLAGCRFEGDVARGRNTVDDGFPTGYGLGLAESRDCRVEGCTVTRFHRGLVVSACAGIAVRGNDLHGLRSDGMNFAQVRRVTIEGNTIRDFDRAPASDDHPDMIQFWTSGTTAPSADIVIRGNLLSSGRGVWTQSIFIRNELVDQGLAGAEMLYRNVLIEENAILNAHLHGITVGETAGLVIRNNTLLRNPRSEGDRPDPGLWTPRINVASAARDVAILRNVAAEVSGWDGQPDWRVAGNVTVQDRSRLEPGFYGDLFTGDPADPGSLAYRKGGPLDGAGVGARFFQR